MKITIVGTGYVGLVTGACLADRGHDVICVDRDAEKIERLTWGDVPFYEPGLDELIKQNVAARRLWFMDDPAPAVESAEIVFLMVGTPSLNDGSADLSNLWDAIGDIVPFLTDNVVVVIKSTVPPGTNAKVAKALKAATGKDVAVVSNPEFLREGSAVKDFMEPDRIVIGIEDPADCGRRARNAMYELYPASVVLMSPESAELAKYACNGFLATKISYVNTMAGLCEQTGAEIDDVVRVMASDGRIGPHFLRPGVGYGGSCFPKDVRALKGMLRCDEILDAVDLINDLQRGWASTKLHQHFGPLVGKTVAVWGLAFKPGTDDVRESTAVDLVRQLLDHDTNVRAYDPKATENAVKVVKDGRRRIVWCGDWRGTLHRADALVVMTEWLEFAGVSWAEVERLMKGSVVLDGRNIVKDPAELGKLGLTYYGVGRKTVRGCCEKGRGES